MEWEMFVPKLDFTKGIKQHYRRAQENIAKTAEVNRARQKGKNRPVEYAKGDMVIVRCEVTGIGLSNKLKAGQWSKPVELLEVRENNVKIRDGKGMERWIAKARIKMAERELDF